MQYMYITGVLFGLLNIVIQLGGGLCYVDRPSGFPAGFHLLGGGGVEGLWGGGGGSLGVGGSG